MDQIAHELFEIRFTILKGGLFFPPERRSMKNILGFQEDGLRAIHFYINGLDYPVVAAEYTDHDTCAFQYLDSNVKAGIMNSEQICEWCMNHRIYFRLLYGIRLRHILLNPRKAWEFLELRFRLKQYAQMCGFS